MFKKRFFGQYTVFLTGTNSSTGNIDVTDHIFLIQIFYLHRKKRFLFSVGLVAAMRFENNFSSLVFPFNIFTYAIEAVYICNILIK